MTKHWRKIVFISFCLLGVIILQSKNFSPTAPLSAPGVHSPKKDFDKLEIDGKKVVGLPRGREKKELEKLKVVNTPSPHWEESLRETLLTQGGSRIKDINFQKVDSFIWTQDGLALNVESLIVRLKSDKNNEISFRLLVDAQNGKILRNWDQPVIDPINPREDFAIRVDPRYHQ